MRIQVWITAGLLLLLVAAGCSTNKDLLAQKDQQIGELQQRVASLESELGSERDRAAALNADLDSALSDYQQKEQVLLEKIEDRTVITISEAMLFSSGSVQLTQTATDILDKVGEVTGNYPDREIRVEGHTDNVGIALEFQDRFKSNWELSTARATSVVHYLRRQHNVPADRIAAVGYGEYRPVADNSTPEGRRTNRRVVIRVGPMP
jgi:chemotaxis protein MotB